MPFLLNQLRIPADMFQLHVMTLVYVGRFATMLAVMHVTAVAIIAACAVNGLATINVKKLARQLVLSAACLLMAVMVPSMMFKFTVDPEYKGYQTFIEQDNLYPHEAGKIYNESLPKPSVSASGSSRLDMIRKRGLIRVGFFKDSLPYVFFNDSGKLVGYDTEMAHLLAQELGVKIEHVLIEHEKMAEMLDQGYVDIVMSKIYVTTHRLEQVAFSTPYTYETFAFVVKDHLQDKFSSRNRVKAMQDLKVGVIALPYLAEKLQNYLPDAEVVPLSSVRDYFRGKTDFDAMVYTAESGSAWSLIYPDYSVSVPRPDIVSIPVAYALPQNDLKMKNLIDSWIELKRRDETTDELFDYWILGKSVALKKKRWSVIRDVLGWVE
jgi:ABC-type amino acid transport substrate-binding protein